MSRESGIYNKWIKDTISNNIHQIHEIFHEENEEKHDFHVLTLNNVFGVYLLYFSGISLSLIIFLCEFIYKLMFHKSVNKIRNTHYYEYQKNRQLFKTVNNSCVTPVLKYPTRHAIYGQLFVFKTNLYCIERRHGKY